MTSRKRTPRIGAQRSKRGQTVTIECSVDHLGRAIIPEIWAEKIVLARIKELAGTNYGPALFMQGDTPRYVVTDQLPEEKDTLPAKEVKMVRNADRFLYTSDREAEKKSNVDQFVNVLAYAHQQKLLAAPKDCRVALLDLKKVGERLQKLEERISANVYGADEQKEISALLRDQSERVLQAHVIKFEDALKGITKHKISHYYDKSGAIRWIASKLLTQKDCFSTTLELYTGLFPKDQNKGMKMSFNELTNTLIVNNPKNKCLQENWEGLYSLMTSSSRMRTILGFDYEDNEELKDKLFPLFPRWKYCTGIVGVPLKLTSNRKTLMDMVIKTIHDISWGIAPEGVGKNTFYSLLAKDRSTTVIDESVTADSVRDQLTEYFSTREMRKNATLLRLRQLSNYRWLFRSSIVREGVLSDLLVCTGWYYRLREKLRTFSFTRVPKNDAQEAKVNWFDLEEVKGDEKSPYEPRVTPSEGPMKVRDANAARLRAAVLKLQPMMNFSAEKLSNEERKTFIRVPLVARLRKDTAKTVDFKKLAIRANFKSPDQKLVSFLKFLQQHGEFNLMAPAIIRHLAGYSSVMLRTMAVEKMQDTIKFRKAFGDGPDDNDEEFFSRVGGLGTQAVDPLSMLWDDEQ